MAKFRLVHTSFWNDPRVVEEMTAEDKYFFLYLLTNENTTQIGIYQITKKQIAFDIGYSIDAVGALIQRFTDHHKLIKYNPETREIAIKNWGKYNLVKGGKPIIDCVKSELKNVKDISLIPFVSQKITNPKIRELYDTYYESITKHERNVDDTLTIRQKNEETNNINGFYDTYHDTSTLGGQEKQQEQQQEKEKQEEKEKQQQLQQEESCRQSLLSSEKLSQLVKFYDENIQRMSGYIYECIVHMLNENDSDLVMEAFKIAAKKQPSSPIDYIESILRNWRNDFITDINQLRAKEAREENAKSQRSHANGQISRNDEKNAIEIPADIDAKLRNFSSI